MINAKKLAAAAREIAMECAAGTALRFGKGKMFTARGAPSCAVGHVLARIGATSYPVEFDGYCSLYRMSFMNWTEDANDGALPADRNDAVIFPLLAWADELDALP